MNNTITLKQVIDSLTIECASSTKSLFTLSFYTKFNSVHLLQWWTQSHNTHQTATMRKLLYYNIPKTRLNIIRNEPISCTKLYINHTVYLIDTTKLKLSLSPFPVGHTHIHKSVGTTDPIRHTYTIMDHHPPQLPHIDSLYITLQQTLYLDKYWGVSSPDKPRYEKIDHSKDSDVLSPVCNKHDYTHHKPQTTNVCTRTFIILTISNKDSRHIHGEHLQMKTNSWGTSSNENESCRIQHAHESTTQNSGC